MMAGRQDQLSLLLLACVIVGIAHLAHAQAPYKLPRLPYAAGAIEPNIDYETMKLHHGRHHNASVRSLNIALAKVPKSISSLPLTTLLARVGGSYGPKIKIPSNTTAAIRNSGGGHFNHAMFWKTLRPTKSKVKNVLSPKLTVAMNKTFGGVSDFNCSFTEAASGVFGSGWAWLCYKPKQKKLEIVTTPNQDNPLMRNIVPAKQQCIPILGIDVWEHAYYLKHRNVRDNYIAAFWKAINWVRVSRNYDNAIAGRLEALWK